MKKIKKIAQSFGVLGKVLNSKSNSLENTYSCNYINKRFDGTEPMGSIIVDDISYKNILNISSNNHTHTTNAGSDNSTIVFTETGYTVNNMSMSSEGRGVGDWFYVPLKIGQKYTLSYDSDGFENVRIFKLDKQTTIIGSSNNHDELTFISEEDGCYFRTWTLGGTEKTLNWAMIELGEKATSYSPYKDFSNKQIYSTEEKIVGKYTNGKNIYKKTFIGVTSPTAGLTKLMEYVDTLILCEGEMNTPGGIGYNFPFYTDGTHYFKMHHNIASHVVSIDTSYVSRMFEVTLTYTKSTD